MGKKSRRTAKKTTTTGSPSTDASDYVVLDTSPVTTQIDCSSDFTGGALSEKSTANATDPTDISPNIESNNEPGPISSVCTPPNTYKIPSDSSSEELVTISTADEISSVQHPVVSPPPPPSLDDSKTYQAIELSTFVDSFSCERNISPLEELQPDEPTPETPTPKVLQTDLTGCLATTTVRQPPNTVSENHMTEVIRLQDELSSMSLRLLRAQEQVDRLLEEKRSWLTSTQFAPQPPPAATGELRGRLVQAKTLADTYRREKENMVIKYAQSEQKCLRLEKQLTQLMLKNSTTNSVVPNATTAGTDKTETTGLEERSEAKWLDLQSRLTCSEKQLESLKKDRGTDATRINNLETKISQAQELLRGEQRTTNVQTETINRLKQSLEVATKQAKEAERLREREAGRLCAEKSYRETQEQVKRLTAENETLKQQVEQLDGLKTQLNDKEHSLSELSIELAALHDARQELEASKRREEHSSEFTRRLTERNANLQAEHLSALSRLTSAEQQVREFEKAVNESTSEVDRVTTQQEARLNELESRAAELQDQLTESHGQVDQLRNRLNDEQEQGARTHKRDLGRIRDLVRQLSRAAQSRPLGSSEQKFGDGVDRPANVTDTPDSISLSQLSADSRAESLHSIDLNQPTSGGLGNQTSNCIIGNSLMATGERFPTKPMANEDTQWSAQPNQSIPTASATPTVEDRFEESERTAWIAKIDRLQRLHVRMSDKVDFLQEYGNQLSEELTKKNRVIQSFIVSEKRIVGASPDHTHLGGFLSSVHSGKSSFKDAPDRATCVQILEHLQAVLEDTMLKNVTLKDNVNTLGDEISRLNSSLTAIREKLCANCTRLAKETTSPSQSPSKSDNRTTTTTEAQALVEPPTFCGGGVSV